MKILLINPQKLIEPPIGLLSIASVLEKDGHEVSILEIPILGKDRRDELDRGVCAEVSAKGPDIVGITCTSPDALIVKKVCAALRLKHPKVKVVAGGIHPTVLPKEVLSWGADVVVRGEGEETIRELMRYFAEGGDLGLIAGIAFSKEGKPVVTPERCLVENLDTLPFPAYHLLDGSRFSKRSYSIRGKWLRCAAIITSRGCFGRCTFCASNSVHRRSIRWLSINRIMDEIGYFLNRYEIEGLYISDDSFTLNKARVLDFCSELNKRNIRLHWACQSRVGGLTEDMLKCMKSSGLVQIEFGVESGSQRVLNFLKKGIKVESTIREFELCRAHGVRTLANVMIGIPGETTEDIDMTRQLIKRIRPDFTAAFFCVPFPGTDLYEDSLKSGLIKQDQEIDWQMITEPMFNTTIPREKLIEAYDALQKDNSGFFIGYLKDTNFLADMARLGIRHPAPMTRLIGLYGSGRRYEAQSLFLHIFRKYHLNM